MINFLMIMVKVLVVLIFLMMLIENFWLWLFCLESWGCREVMVWVWFMVIWNISLYMINMIISGKKKFVIVVIV